MEPTEQSPLLQHESDSCAQSSSDIGDDNSPTAPPVNDESPPGTTHDVPASFPARNMMFCALTASLLVLLESSSFLQEVPFNQVLEDNICRQLHHQAANSIDCGQDKDVQAELALLKGWKDTLDLLPGIITAVPYGFMADKYGSKPILILCLIGVTLNAYFFAAVCFWPSVFPVRISWVSSIFMFMGGGIAVLSSMIFSTLSRLAPESYRATVFFSLSASVMVSELVVMPLTSVLMKRSPWLPITIGLCIQPFAILLGLFLPEAKETIPPDAPNAGETTPPSDLRNDEDQITPDADGKISLLSRLRTSASQLGKAALLFVCGDYRVTLLLITLLTTTLGKMAQGVLLQYARNKFKWTWSQTGFLVSYKAAIILVLLLVVLPAINYALVKVLCLPPKRKDFYVARASAMFLTMGNLCIGLAMSSAIFILGLSIWCIGVGYNLVLRSLLTQLIEPHHQGTLFTIIAVVEELGALVAGPLLAICFRVSLSLEGIWTGLPYLSAACLSLIAVIILYCIRV